VVFRSSCCKGGTGLWTAGLEEDVKDSIQKDGLFVIEVVVGYGFCVDVESFNSVKVGALHNLIHRAERMAFFVKVFCEAVGMVIVLEGCFVLSVSRGETSTSLSDIRLVAFEAGEFVCS